jgi:heme-degrading monooxygenase HmoA
MVTIGMNYRVLLGKEAAFEATFHNLLEVLKGSKGHTSSRMFREVDDLSHYVILSEWSDRAAFDTFIASDAFRSTADMGRRELLAGRPTHTYYEH